MQCVKYCTLENALVVHAVRLWYSNMDINKKNSKEESDLRFADICGTVDYLSADKQFSSDQHKAGVILNCKW